MDDPAGFLVRAGQLRFRILEGTTWTELRAINWTGSRKTGISSISPFIN
jgi:hypothetical protein